MGNQQERLIAAARLAMLIDAEGWISFRVVRRSIHRRLNIVPIVAITNTDVAMIEWARDTLDALGISPYVQWVKPGRHEDVVVGKLMQGRVIVQGFLRLKALLPLIRPWLIIKHRQADAINAFISSRMAADVRAPYSRDELILVDEVRRMRSKGPRLSISSETLRQTASVRMIESDLRAKAAEAARNERPATPVVVSK